MTDLQMKIKPETEEIIETLTEKLVNWLAEHGPATAREIAQGADLNLGTTRVELSKLSRLGILQAVSIDATANGDWVKLWDLG